ncbi:MAG: trmB, partial [Phycisphaerales bacterium]|nr:trmB [Phycisphaerales bacterium]
MYVAPTSAAIPFRSVPLSPTIARLMEVPRRRSIFVDRLLPYAAFAFGENAISSHRGHWSAFFRDRIGPTFDGRVILEIGCSDGAFLARLAAKHPTTAFVGLDWKHKSLFIAAQRVEQLSLRNIALLRGRGQDLAAMFAPGEVDEILLFHPDPFAEPEELPNRLFAEPFLLAAHGLLRNEGSTLTLKTDHPGYYGWALSILGLTEPSYFATARARAAADPALAKKLTGEPRIRANDLLAIADRPARSGAAIDRFAVAANS